jgi:signal transduction histidine kinase
MEQPPQNEACGPVPLSLPFRAFGWVAFAGAFALALRLVYEQTVMTWSSGLQMVGFTLVHIYGGLFVFGLLAALCVHIWLFGFIAALIRRRLADRVGVPLGAWVQFALLATAAALFYIPYGFWQLASLELAGPGHQAVDQLAAAASQNQKYLVKAFLKNGVPIDAPDYYGKSALDQACGAERLDIARYLVSKGADLDRAPDCRKVTEFAALMKPAAPPVLPQSGRPQVPGTTVDVTAPEPGGGFPQPKVKP